MSAQFGRLTFIKRLAGRKSLYQCSCGSLHEAYTYNVTSGKTSSCGCFQREETIRRSTKHGGAKRGQHSRAYNSWENMIGRCTQSSRPDYHRYGGRGITVCERWLDFNNFLEDMGEPPVGKSLDRYPNNETGNYEPGNCRWATAKEQANNRRPRSKP